MLAVWHEVLFPGNWERRRLPCSAVGMRPGVGAPNEVGSGRKEPMCKRGWGSSPPPRGSWSCHTVINGTVFLSVPVYIWKKLE